MQCNGLPRSSWPGHCWIARKHPPAPSPIRWMQSEGHSRYPHRSCRARACPDMVSAYIPTTPRQHCYLLHVLYQYHWTAPATHHLQFLSIRRRGASRWRLKASPLWPRAAQHSCWVDWCCTPPAASQGAPPPARRWACCWAPVADSGAPNGGKLGARPAGRRGRRGGSAGRRGWPRPHSSHSGMPSEKTGRGGGGNKVLVTRGGGSSSVVVKAVR